MKGHTFWSDLKNYRVLLLMLAPAVAFFLLFAYIPMAGIIIAFKHYDYAGGIFGSAWNGLDNFRFFFESGDAWRVTRNTALYNIAFIIVNNSLQIFAAIMLFEVGGKWFRKITQSALFLPYFISWVVVGAIAYNLLNYDIGTVNALLRGLGLEPVDIYNTPSYWPYILVLVSAWKGLGYGTVMYLAAITGIDTEMYEAAEIDGANIFQRIMKVTIPNLYPTIIILVLLAVGNIFRGDFGMFYNMIGNNGLLFSSTDVIDTFVFRSLITSNDIGMSAAAGVFQSVLGFVTIMTRTLLSVNTTKTAPCSKRIRSLVFQNGGNDMKQLDRKIFSGIGYVSLIFLAILCIFPFVLVVSSSFTEENKIITEGYQFIPTAFSTEAYSILFKYPEQMIQAYLVTIAVTIIGTLVGLFLTSMTAYALSRKDFKWRNKFSFFFFFTTLFSGGLVPWYLLMVNYLDMKDTLAALVIPMMLNVFYIIVMKSFMGSIPEAIVESAKIDGAGDFKIYARLILPLSKPALATIGLFLALAYWNDWYNALLFISNENLMPLQYYLYKMLGNMDGMRKAMMGAGAVVTTSIPTESLKMAMTVVATGPILLAYPFVQKYFVQGLTIGAVKG